MELYLTPLRNKSLLTPRETQLLCKQVEQLHCFHIVLLRRLQSQSLKALVTTFHQHLPQLEIYKVFIHDYPTTAAMLSVRRSSSKALSSWLGSVLNRPEAEEKSIEALLSRPIQHIEFYRSSFLRILELTNEADRTALRAKVLAITSSLERMIDGNEVNILEVARNVAGIAAVQRLRKGKTIQSIEYEWLLKLRTRKVKLLEEIPMVDVTVILQEDGEADQLQLHVKRATLLVLNAALVVCKAPKQWSRSFEGEQPQLSACAVLAGGFFTCRKTTEEEDFPTLHLQSTCELQRVSEALLRFTDLEDSLALEKNVNHMDKAIEPVWSITCGEKDRIVTQNAVSRLSRDTPPAQFSSPDKVLIAASEVSKLPGLNMLERRRIAEEIRKQRGAWVPAEKEKMTAQLARQRIRMRDGLEPEEPNPATSPKAHTPALTKDKHFSAWTESAQRRRHNKALSKRAVSFTDKRRSSAGRRWSNAEQAVDSSREQFEWTNNFGIDRSERFDDDREEKSEQRAVNMSIFRAPPPKGTNAARSPQERLERFIGLDWHGSQMMKEQYRSEEKRLAQRKR